MSGHTGGICVAHGRVWPCSVCASVAIDVPAFPYPAEPTYTVSEIRERLKTEVEHSAGDWFFIDDLLARAFPESREAIDG